MATALSGGRSGAPASVRRLMVALCVSLLVHAVIMLMPGGAGEAPSGTASSVVQMRLERHSVPAPDPLQAIAQAHADAPAPDVPQAGDASRASQRAGPVAPVSARMDRDTSGGPAARFFLARELDHYPVPQTPLTIGGIRHGHGGLARIWVRIDERGQVIDAVADDPGSDDGFLERVRELLLATRFVPARRDGRAVRSRLLLSLAYEP